METRVNKKQDRKSNDSKTQDKLGMDLNAVKKRKLKFRVLNNLETRVEKIHNKKRNGTKKQDKLGK